MVEDLAVEPKGEGEHIWLQVTKRRQNTETVAKALARHADVAYRDVGYSGLKDFNAVTQQWFSIYQPKAQPIDWSAFDFSGVQIDKISRHVRKIKRGTHKSNHFAIKIRDFTGDLSDFKNRIKLIGEQGVPNYFGVQRFGRDLNNMRQAIALLVKRQKFKDRHLQSMLYSSARSWLFNCVLSERIANDSWARLHPGEPTNLNGTNSLFNAENSVDEEARLAELDIHPTAPMWGKYSKNAERPYPELHQMELAILDRYADLCVGLEKAALDYQRRALRMKIKDLRCDMDGNELLLQFGLQKGQFATSVLRELLRT